MSIWISETALKSISSAKDGSKEVSAWSCSLFSFTSCKVKTPVEHGQNETICYVNYVMCWHFCKYDFITSCSVFVTKRRSSYFCSLWCIGSFPCCLTVRFFVYHLPGFAKGNGQCRNAISASQTWKRTNPSLLGVTHTTECSVPNHKGEIGRTIFSCGYGRNLKHILAAKIRSVASHFSTEAGPLARQAKQSDSLRGNRTRLQFLPTHRAPTPRLISVPFHAALRALRFVTLSCNRAFPHSCQSPAPLAPGVRGIKDSKDSLRLDKTKPAFVR